MGAEQLLDRTTILEADDALVEACHVPEWGGVVRLRVITGRERDRWEAAAYKATEKGGSTEGLKARLVIASAVDADGKPLFRNEDLAALQGKNAVAINRLFDAARKLNGIGDDEAREILGESKGAPSGGPGSA